MGVPIGVQNKSNVFHLSIGESLLEGNSELLKALASFYDVVDGDGDVAKSFSRFRVSVGVAFEVGIILRAVIMGELEDAFAGETSGFLLLVGQITSLMIESEEVKREIVEL